MSLRCRRIAAWLVLAGWVLLTQGVAAVELISGPEVETGAGTATIRWRTDVVAGGRVQWGTTPGKLTQRQQGPTGTNHAVTLRELKSGATYHFTVGTARVPLATNAFTMPKPGASPGQVVVSPSPAPSPSTVPLPGAAPVGPSPVTAPGSGGVTASPVALPQAPPTAVTWGSMRSLQDHFERHGRDFGAKNADDYARQAWLFLQRGRAEGLPAKRDSDGVLRVYDPATRSFGAYNRDGTTRTFFKPGRRDYFQDQPGRPVNLKEDR